MATKSIPWNCISVVQVFICRKFGAITINCSLNSAEHRWFFGMSNCQNKISLFDFSSDCDKTSSPAASTLIATLFLSAHFSIAQCTHSILKTNYSFAPHPTVRKKILFDFISFSFQFPFSSWLHFSRCIVHVYRLPTQFHLGGWVCMFVWYNARFPRWCEYCFAIFVVLLLFFLLWILFDIPIPNPNI